MDIYYYDEDDMQRAMEEMGEEEISQQTAMLGEAELMVHYKGAKAIIKAVKEITNYISGIDEDTNDRLGLEITRTRVVIAGLIDVEFVPDHDEYYRFNRSNGVTHGLIVGIQDWVMNIGWQPLVDVSIFPVYLNSSSKDWNIEFMCGLEDIVYYADSIENLESIAECNEYMHSLQSDLICWTFIEEGK